VRQCVESMTITAQREKVNIITLKVKRYNPETGVQPWLQTYTIPTHPGMTILDALMTVKESLDRSLSLRYSCRMGICGSCGMRINGVERLACQTQISELKGDVVRVEPLRYLTVIRDLITNLTPFFDKHREVRPYMIRKDEEEQEHPAKEYLQTEGEMERYIQFASCILCGLCFSSCPTVAIDLFYLGPHALAQAYRYNSDSRDQGEKSRLQVVDAAHGVWRCHTAGSCSMVCPKGVDPALAIILLKKKM